MSFVTSPEVDYFKEMGNLPPNNVMKWASQKQSDHVADSTESAETVAAVCATKDIIWIRDLLKTLGLMTNDTPPSILAGDNKSTLINIYETKTHTTNRYMARKTAVAREAFKDGATYPWYRSSKQNPSDGFTKFLAPIDHQRCFDPFMESAERSQLLPLRRVADDANHRNGSRATQQGDSPLHS